MKTILAHQFDERTVDQVNACDADGIVILKEGTPVARLVPVASGAKPLTGSEVIATYKEQVKLNGDVFSTGIRWDAEFGHSYRPVRDQPDAQTEGKGRP